MSKPIFSFPKKTITIRNDQDQFIKDSNLNLSRLVQKTLDNLMHKPKK